MHIALCCNGDVQSLEQTLSAFGEVVVFSGEWDRPPSVQLAYYMTRGRPCDLAVVALDGAAGMLDCKQIKGFDKKLPVLWISEQEEFWKESNRMGVEEFLVRPVPEGMLRKVAEHLIRTGCGGILDEGNQ